MKYETILENAGPTIILRLVAMQEAADKEIIKVTFSKDNDSRD